MKKILLFLTLLIIPSLLLSQEKEVALTIYTDNLALVKDVRTIELKKGIREVKFQDVAAKIDPTSVHFKSLTAPEKVAILEQNFEYDLVNPSKILEKYVDQQIRVLAEEGKVFEGKLLSSAQGDIVLEDKEGSIKIIKGKTVHNLEFPKLPEGLITRPTLVWLLDVERGGKHRTELSYLTNGIGWHAEYVAVTKKKDTLLELGGWVSIDNKSGATYENARLKLIAGEVHRAVPPPRPRRPLTYELMAKAAAQPQFEEKAFFEYHLYTLKRRATLKDNQIKQISLFPPTETRVEKIYTYEGARDGRKVRVNLEFKNSKEDGLGIPLPRGKVRVYKEDEDKSLEFIGEDFIDHTPKDEKVRIYLGNAFDIVGERTKKSTKKIGERARREEWQIKIRNHKDELVEVVVIERFWGDWEILKSSHKFIKKDARTAEFKVAVPKDGQTVIEYTVLYQW